MFNGEISELLTNLRETFASRKISVENVHLDFFIAKIREKMYTATDKDERAMLRDVYKAFVSEKERFMYNVTARVAIETALLEGFDLVEDFKVKTSMAPTNTIVNASPVIPSDSFVANKVELFTNVFKLMFEESICNIMFNGTRIEYIKNKDSLCFYMATPELVNQAKIILKDPVSQNIKSIAGFTGFLVNLNNM